MPSLDEDVDAPSMRWSGQPIEYELVSAATTLGMGDPTPTGCLTRSRVKILAHKRKALGTVARRSTKAHSGQSMPHGPSTV
ncbi:hypothetical protein GUJ93_ZPchr0004g40195 [Zizania palustris]|uniref:Uncharacterized protein n=1 Tax=Zizania palustris TaxID=103762 RepID=A0A8J5SJC5_ZIZPA|nr:hypothetical protein GUJ93_ZPchr0004g40195 [Zizania palustris]